LPQRAQHRPKQQRSGQAQGEHAPKRRGQGAGQRVPIEGLRWVETGCLREQRERFGHQQEGDACAGQAQRPLVVRDE